MFCYEHLMLFPTNSLFLFGEFYFSRSYFLLSLWNRNIDARFLAPEKGCKSCDKQNFYLVYFDFSLRAVYPLHNFCFI